MKRTILAALILFFTMLFTLSATATAAPLAQDDLDSNLWQIIQEDERFSTLETMLEEAGMADTLTQSGPFTVFVPANQAFDQFDADSAAPNTEEILTYHVVDGYFEVGRMLDHQTLTTLLGDHINVTVAEGDITLDGATTVTDTSIIASNGVIHVIDSVLVPELEGQMTDEGDDVVQFPATTGTDDQEMSEDAGAYDGVNFPAAPGDLSDNSGETSSLSEYLLAEDRLQTLYDLLIAADLLETLQARDDYTLLAPTDAAFDDVSMDQLETWLANEDALEIILLHHVIGDSVGVNQIATDDTIPVLSGGEIYVELDDGTAMVNEANFVEFEDQLENGTIILIDELLTE